MPSQLPEPVCSTMQALTSGLSVVLGDRLIGVYLGGSVSMGDYCDSSSDLDFLVITRGPLSQEDGISVGLLHRELLQRFPDAARLEGDYAPVEYLVPEGTIAPVPGCERGVFLPKVGELMLSADRICKLWEHGIAFSGPHPREVLPPVTGDQVRCAVRETLMHGADACETPEEAASAVLNLVRSALVIQSGQPATKTAGADWALTHLDPDWHPLIRAALAVRRGEGTPADAVLLREQLGALARFVRNRCA